LSNCTVLWLIYGQTGNTEAVVTYDYYLGSTSVLLAYTAQRTTDIDQEWT